MKKLDIINLQALVIGNLSTEGALTEKGVESFQRLMNLGLVTEDRVFSLSPRGRAFLDGYQTALDMHDLSVVALFK